MLNEENIALYAFRKFGDTALQAAFCCIGNRADAEDIAQEIFFALHRNPREFNDDQHLKAYILRAVINRCTNLRKSFWWKMRVSLEDVKESELSEEQDAKAAEIIAMIQALPPPYNAVVYLHDCEGYTLREIADILGKKENTIGAQLRRGREKLRMELTESGGAL